MRVEVVRLPGLIASRVTLEPGWRWSQSLQSIDRTDLCQVRHVGAVISGRLHVVHADGTVGDAGPADVFVIEPGHDAWVVGNDPVVTWEFGDGGGPGAA